MKKKLITNFNNNCLSYEAKKNINITNKASIFFKYLNNF